MRNSSSLDWLRFMHTPNDYRVSLSRLETHTVKHAKKPLLPSNNGFQLILSYNLLGYLDSNQE